MSLNEKQRTIYESYGYVMSALYELTLLSLAILRLSQQSVPLALSVLNRVGKCELEVVNRTRRWMRVACV